MEDVRTGLVVATLGRLDHLRDLLDSLQTSTVAPVAVVLANQGPPIGELGGLRPFPVHVVASSGGISAARNDGLAALPPGLDYVGFPNDHSRYAPDTLAALSEAVVRHRHPEAVAGALQEPDGLRFQLPPEGTALDRRSVWRAIEPAMFIATRALPATPFDRELGTGGPTAWQSGEGTDLLLRLLAAGGRVVSCPSVRVLGRGERRELTAQEYRVKLRAYARGTGMVYRRHDYPVWQRGRLVLAPWLRWLQSRDPSPERVRAAFQTSLGRWEGVRGRPVTRSPHRRR